MPPECSDDKPDRQRGAQGEAVGAETVDTDLFGRAPKTRKDWSHRRGEPRGLALGWTLYLMGATVGSLAPVMRVSRVDSTVYRPAARLLMVLIVVGGCVLWPMLRASQDRPGSPGRDVFRDLLILLVPALTLVWPQVLLAGWPVPIVGAVSLLMVGWFSFVGAWLCLLYGRDEWGSGPRLAAAVVPALVTCVLPGVLWFGGVMSASPPALEVTPGWMWTPGTAVWELVRDRSWSGGPVWMGRGHRAWAWSVCVAGVLCFVLCAVARRGDGRDA